MDVKPNNFVFFRDKLKIIDFETAVVCGKHNKEEELKSRNKLKLFIYLFIILTSFSVSRARVDRQVWIYCRRRMTSFSPIIFHLLPLLSSALLFPPILSPLPLFRTHPASVSSLSLLNCFQVTFARDVYGLGMSLHVMITKQTSTVVWFNKISKAVRGTSSSLVCFFFLFLFSFLFLSLVIILCIFVNFIFHRLSNR